jgi:hypothetical protein
MSVIDTSLRVLDMVFNFRRRSLERYEAAGRNQIKKALNAKAPCECRFIEIPCSSWCVKATVNRESMCSSTNHAADFHPEQALVQIDFGIGRNNCVPVGHLMHANKFCVVIQLRYWTVLIGREIISNALDLTTDTVSVDNMRIRVLHYRKGLKLIFRQINHITLKWEAGNESKGTKQRRLRQAFIIRGHVGNLIDTIPTLRERLCTCPERYACSGQSSW